MADQATIPLYQLALIASGAVLGLVGLIVFATFLPDIARAYRRLNRAVRRARRSKEVGGGSPAGRRNSVERRRPPFSERGVKEAGPEIAGPPPPCKGR